MTIASYNLLSYDRIPSTQTLALQMIADGAITDRTVILAAAQTAGRGRCGRGWVSKKGNFYASFAYAMTERRPTISYAFAVAAAETLLSFGIPATIKWPNDILADGKKLAGMILEYCGGFLVVGVGINIKSSPTVEKYATTKTDAFAKGLTPDALLEGLIRNFDKWRRAGFAAIRARWTELSIDLNSPITYRGKPALYCGLNEAGAMVMLRGDKYELVYGDEIFT
jgi:BirA family biotin operon repressor/biotin-[acetyl-CoA-carboxylase] ligase